MKIGVSSYSFSKHLASTQCGYHAICDKAKEMGYDGIEFIGLVNEKWGITGDPIEIAKDLRTYCEKIGLEIVAYTVGANFLAPDPEETVKKLSEKGIDTEPIRIDEYTGKHMTFFFDPDGLPLEIHE